MANIRRIEICKHRLTSERCIFSETKLNIYTQRKSNGNYNISGKVLCGFKARTFVFLAVY